jgi:FkbM family methyltransferase
MTAPVLARLAHRMRAAVRHVLGRRDHLRRGYHVTTRNHGETSAVHVRTVTSPRGFRFETFTDRMFIVDEFIVTGQYVHALREWRADLTRRATGRTLYVLDAGANIGLFSLFAANVLRTRIHAIGFEPLPANRVLCERNWRHLAHTLRPEALADTDSTDVTLYVPSTTAATLQQQESEAFAFRFGTDVPTATVKVARLDSLWPDLGAPRVDLIKLDIEGAEERALTGASATLAENRPFVICSYEHPSNDRDRIIALVASSGTTYEVVDDTRGRLLLFAPSE